MKSNTANTLLLLNKALFRYNLNFKDIISDYPSFTYFFSTESNGINVKVTLENDYNEKIEYNFRFSL